MSTTTYFYNGDGELVEASSSSDEVIKSVIHRDEIQKYAHLSKHELARLYMAGEIDEATFRTWCQ